MILWEKVNSPRRGETPFPRLRDFPRRRELLRARFRVRI